jgi:hypothetical protein
MATTFFRLCSKRVSIGGIRQSCHCPMTLRKTTPGGGRIMVCSVGHTKEYRPISCQHLGLTTDYIFRELPDSCPVCSMPLRDKNRVTQEDAQTIGRIICDKCQCAWVWNQAEQQWILED